MKKTFSIIAVLMVMLIVTSCAHKLGTFTMITTETNPNTATLKLKEAAVTDKIKFKRKDCIEKSVAYVLKKHEGQAIYNAQIRQNWTGKKIIITGDIYGY